MTMRFALVPQSRRLTTRHIGAIAEVLAKQLRYHVAPAWNRRAPSVIVAGNPAPSDTPILLTDIPDIDAAFGYHSEDDRGEAIAKCFVDPVLESGGGILDGGRAGVSFASVISHEAIETLVDPDASLWMDAEMNIAIADKHFNQIALEACDPAQGVLVPVKAKDGTVVMLSNFCLPAWFDAEEAGPYDRAGVVSKPLALGPGGYVIGRTRGPGSEGEAFADKPLPAWRRRRVDIRLGKP